MHRRLLRFVVAGPYGGAETRHAATLSPPRPPRTPPPPPPPALHAPHSRPQAATTRMANDMSMVPRTGNPSLDSVISALANEDSYPQTQTLDGAADEAPASRPTEVRDLREPARTGGSESGISTLAAAIMAAAIGFLGARMQQLQTSAVVSPRTFRAPLASSSSAGEPKGSGLHTGPACRRWSASRGVRHSLGAAAERPHLQGQLLLADRCKGARSPPFRALCRSGRALTGFRVLLQVHGNV